MHYTIIKFAPKDINDCTFLNMSVFFLCQNRSLHLERDSIRCGWLWRSLMSTKLWKIWPPYRYFSYLLFLPEYLKMGNTLRAQNLSLWKVLYFLSYFSINLSASILFTFNFFLNIGIWSCCPALSQRRRYCKLAAMDNCVWAVGGLDASSAISNVERLDPREGTQKI